MLQRKRDVCTAFKGLPLLRAERVCDGWESPSSLQEVWEVGGGLGVMAFGTEFHKL